MSKFLHSRFSVSILALLAALLLSACASTAPGKAGTEAEAPQTVEVEPWDGDGMDIPLDGSSMEAWDTSMARVKAHTSEKQYIALGKAIKYHLMYDLPSYRDMNKLIKRLDGQTGNEILSQVNWINQGKGKAPASKASEDNESIET